MSKENYIEDEDFDDSYEMTEQSWIKVANAIQSEIQLFQMESGIDDWQEAVDAYYDLRT